jgi:hypothetical protein
MPQRKEIEMKKISAVLMATFAVAVAVNAGEVKLSDSDKAIVEKLSAGISNINVRINDAMKKFQSQMKSTEPGSEASMLILVRTTDSLVAYSDIFAKEANLATTNKVFRQVIFTNMVQITDILCSMKKYMTPDHTPTQKEREAFAKLDEDIVMLRADVSAVAKKVK